MRDLQDRKTILEDRLAELDARLHRIEDRLDDPVSKDWEDQAVEREDSEVLQDLGQSGLKENSLIRELGDPLPGETNAVPATVSTNGAAASSTNTIK